MRFIVIIPARCTSGRFPGKLLAGLERSIRSLDV